MKKYTKPEMEINAFENTDVVTVSAGIVETNFKFEKGYNAVEF
jgi:hypothetical protein